MAEERICKIHHAQALGYCATGIRKWCKIHDLSFKLFLKEGFTVKELIDTKDALALKLVEFSKRKKNGQ